MCDEYTLKDKTETYWNKFDQGANIWIPWYINNLLALEIDYAIKSGRIKPETLTGIRPLTLVQLVGYSIEPLLQTICIYKPDHIILVASPKYYSLQKNSGVYNLLSGKQFVEKFIKGYLSQLQQQNLIEKQPECIIHQLSTVTPSAVFQTLLSALKIHSQGSIVVDVTGGKKSMITGAYLYAAFDRNARLSYVDFDDTLYDRDRGRPYGYGCQIGQLANPYQDFALHNWERVQSFYHQYNFQAALDLLVGHDGKKGTETLWYIAHELETEAQQSGSWCTAIDKLVAVLEFYRLWDTGNYAAAHQTIYEKEQNPTTQTDKKRKQGNLGSLPDSAIPTAVQELDEWVTFTGTTPQLIDNFFDDNLRLRVYVHDELARIRRLIYINEDYRSAFLRAGGLNEVLMVSRWFRQCIDSVHKTTLNNNVKKMTPNIKNLFEELRKPVGSRMRISTPAYTEEFDVIRQMNEWWIDTGFTITFNSGKVRNAFTDLRNKLAHTYVSVPDHIARDGLAFIEANFKDFQATTLHEHLNPLSFQTEAFPWSKLCKACGLDQWLHPALATDL